MISDVSCTSSVAAVSSMDELKDEKLYSYYFINCVKLSFSIHAKCKMVLSNVKLRFPLLLYSHLFLAVSIYDWEKKAALISCT